MTTTVTSGTCERSFSKMKTINTTLRNTMGDLRLNNLFVLSVERDLAIDFDNVAQVFYFREILKLKRFLLLFFTR
jgi:hypothetical protein